MDKAFPTIQEINEFCVKYLADKGLVYDDWVTLSNFWDINFWSEDNVQHITIYPIDLGDTLTQQGIRLR